MSTLKELLKNVPVQWETIGKLSKVLRGKRLTKNDLAVDGLYNVYHGGLDPLGCYGKFNRIANSIMIINVGASAGSVGFSNKDFWSSDGCYTLEHNEFINTKYFYYFLLSKVSYLKSKVRYAGIPTLDAPIIERILIPIPYPNDPVKSLEVQQEIVRILDSLSEQINALTEALASEIASRKKQYDFYREQLFQFEGKEVELIPLGDEKIGEFTRGSGLQKKDFTESGVGCIHYGQVYTFYNTYTYHTKSFVSIEFAKNSRKAKSGALVIATTSENDDDVCKAVAWLGDEDIAVSSDACFYSHTFNPKYVSYYFQTEQFQKQKRKYITGTKVRRVNVNDLEKIKIPVSSTQEQDLIVDILDKFDESTKAIVAELEKEIGLRNKQYEYYRNALLSFPKEEV